MLQNYNDNEEKTYVTPQ